MGIDDGLALVDGVQQGVPTLGIDHGMALLDDGRTRRIPDGHRVASDLVRWGGQGDAHLGIARALALAIGADRDDSTLGVVA